MLTHIGFLKTLNILHHFLSSAHYFWRCISSVNDSRHFCTNIYIY